MSTLTVQAPSYGTGTLGIRAAVNPFLLTYLLTAGSFIVCGFLWGAPGFDLLVVGMGWPHVILGFLFYFNKVLKNEGSHRPHFFWLLASTAAIGFYHSLKPITTLIYLYFVFHAFRDEIFIYYQRLHRHKFSGPVFSTWGWVLLAVVAVAAGVGQLRPRPAVRIVDVSVSQLVSGQPLTITFSPISDSRGKDYYFYLMTGRKGISPVLSYASSMDTHPEGELLVSEKPWRARDLEFQALYTGGEARSPSLPPDPASRVPLLFGGYRVGQTFRAETDNLSGIILPIELQAPVPPDLDLKLRVESAWFVTHPYTYELALTALGVLLTLLAIFQIPRSLFAGLPALRYVIPALFLFAAAVLTMKAARFNALESPLFFNFLVIFHYYSWYVFYVQKILGHGVNAPAKPGVGPYGRFLQWATTRHGFLTLVVSMNVASFAAAYGYQILHLSPALQYGFDLRYFLYFLVFHVTMSFAPKHLAKA